jgi:hypothetical protein
VLDVDPSRKENLVATKIEPIIGFHRTDTLKATNDWKADKNGQAYKSRLVTSSDEIPQPTSILLGSNLRKNSDDTSKKQKEEPKEKEPLPKK